MDKVNQKPRGVNYPRKSIDFLELKNPTGSWFLKTLKVFKDIKNPQFFKDF